jgi:hypothetical protein
MNKGKVPVSVSPQDYESVKAFLVASSDIYLTERSRQIAITELLEKLLNKVITDAYLDMALPTTE